MNTMMMDRNTMGMMNQTGTMPMMGAAPMNMMMIPRCTMTMERCEGGMMMSCTTKDEAACMMMQNLCTMMGGGMVGCCMMMNGMVTMCCSMTMGMCKMEMMKDGMMMTWTSGDAATRMMIEACCDAMMKMMEGGCTCCMTMNMTPVCCGTMS
jgi:hypothetical protein